MLWRRRIFKIIITRKKYIFCIYKTLQVFTLLQASISYGVLGEGYFFKLILMRIFLFIFRYIVNESRELKNNPRCRKEKWKWNKIQSTIKKGISTPSSKSKQSHIFLSYLFINLLSLSTPFTHNTCISSVSNSDQFSKFSLPFYNYCCFARLVTKTTNLINWGKTSWNY